MLASARGYTAMHKTKNPSQTIARPPSGATSAHHTWIDVCWRCWRSRAGLGAERCRAMASAREGQVRSTRPAPTPTTGVRKRRSEKAGNSPQPTLKHNAPNGTKSNVVPPRHGLRVRPADDTGARKLFSLCALVDASHPRCPEACMFLGATLWGIPLGGRANGRPPVSGQEGCVS